MFKTKLSQAFLLGVVTLSILMGTTVLSFVYGKDTLPSAPQVPIKTAADVVKIFCDASFWFLSLVVVLASLAILWAAFKFITAGGEEKNVTSAKQTLTYAVVGIVVALMAFGVIDVVYTFMASSGSSLNIFQGICPDSSVFYTPMGEEYDPGADGEYNPGTGEGNGGGENDGGDSTNVQSCSQPSDCPYGQTCLNNQCIDKLTHGQAGCIDDSDCVQDHEPGCTSSAESSPEGCIHVCQPVNGVNTCVGADGDGCIPGDPAFSLCASGLTCKKDLKGKYRCLRPLSEN